MFKLITIYQETKQEFEAETLDEILSLAINAFDQNHELYEIQENKICIYQCGEIYDLLGKAIY